MKPEFTLGQRAFIWMWRRMTKLNVGAPDPFAEEYVRTYGVKAFMGWIRDVFKLLPVLEKRFGPAEAQMIISFAGLWTGCRWCAVGHLLTGNLELFKREELLGPLDEQRVVELQEMTDPEILAELLERFSGERWDALRPIIERQYMLKSGQVEEETEDDDLIVLTNYMWEWLNECTITGMDFDPTTIPAQAPIGKDRKLVKRYRDARDEAAAKN